MRDRNEGVDIHRIGHHADRGMRLVKRSTTTEEELHLYCTQVRNYRQRNPGIRTATLTEEQMSRTSIAVRRANVHCRVRSAVAKNTQALCKLSRDARDGIFRSRTCLKIKGVRDLAHRCYRHKRIAVGPFRTGCFDIHIVRSVPTMVGFQLVALIMISCHRSLINDSLLSRVIRVNLRIRDQHVVRSGVTFPSDIGIRITRIDGDLGYLVDILAILDRQVIHVE